MSLRSDSDNKEPPFIVEGIGVLKNDGLLGSNNGAFVDIKANRKFFVVCQQDAAIGCVEFARISFRDIQMQPYGNSAKKSECLFLVTYTKKFQKEFFKDNPNSAMAHVSFVLKDAALIRFFKESLASCRGYHIRNFIVSQKTLLLGFFSLVGILFAAHCNATFLVNTFVSDKMARDMGERVVKSHPFIQNDVCLDSTNSDYIASIENAFAKTSYAIKPTIRVIPNDDINAFALPGGLIYVHSELIKKAENSDELVGVLAHEYGHSVHKHSLLSFVKISIIEYFTNLFFGSDSIANIFTLIEGLRYSREMEREADATALDVLNELNVSHLGLKTFFHRVESLSKKKQKGKEETLSEKDVVSVKNKKESRFKFDLPSFLSTHPHIEDRINKIPEKVDRNTKPLLSESEFADLKKKTERCVVSDTTVTQKIKATFKKRNS